MDPMGNDPSHFYRSFSEISTVLRFAMSLFFYVIFTCVYTLSSISIHTWKSKRWGCFPLRCLPWLPIYSQDYVLAAEQDANEANIETAKCAKEAAIAKEEARTVSAEVPRKHAS